MTEKNLLSIFVLVFRFNKFIVQRPAVLPFDALDNFLHILGQRPLELEAYHVVDDAQRLVGRVGMNEVAESILHIDIHEDIGERLDDNQGRRIVAAVQHDGIDGLGDNEIHEQFGQCVFEFLKREVAAPHYRHSVRPHACPHVEGKHQHKGKYKALRRREKGQHGAYGRDGNHAPLFPVEDFIHHFEGFTGVRKVGSEHNRCNSTRCRWRAWHRSSGCNLLWRWGCKPRRCR